MTDIALQPLLDDAVIVLQAPTQAWSDEAGDMGSAAIHGIYHGDVRHVRALTVAVEGSAVEPIACSSPVPHRAVFTGVLRGLDGDQPDPKVRLDRTRAVRDGAVAERIRISSHRDVAVPVSVAVRLVPDFAPLQRVKAGLPGDAAWAWDGRRVVSEAASFTVTAPGSTIEIEDTAIVLRWSTVLEHRSETEFSVELVLEDPALVVRAPASPGRATVPETTDPRVRRWLDRAADDLAALRLALPAHPDDAFYAAGAPWFFTLFGRDSIWAARLALAQDPGIAASTLRVLGAPAGHEEGSGHRRGAGQDPA